MKLYGRNPVLERLRAHPETIRKIYLQDGHHDTAYIRRKAAKHGLPVLKVPKSKIQKMARNLNSQGVLAQVDEFHYSDFNELLEKASRNKVTLIFADELNDPQNLGAMIRSLACFGHFAVVLPIKESVGITEAVLRVAAGGDNYVEVAQVSNLKKAIVKAKKEGISIAGTVVEEGDNFYGATIPLPVALVIGSEQKGIRPIILKELDLKFRIPMYQNTLSLNVAHATSIFCYEVAKEKNKSKT